MACDSNTLPEALKALARSCTVPDYSQPKVIYARVQITREAFAEIERAREEERQWTRRMRRELGMKPIRVQRVLERLAGRHFWRVLRQEMAATVEDLKRTSAPWWEER